MKINIIVLIIVIFLLANGCHFSREMIDTNNTYSTPVCTRHRRQGNLLFHFPVNEQHMQPSG